MVSDSTAKKLEEQRMTKGNNNNTYKTHFLPTGKAYLTKSWYQIARNNVLFATVVVILDSEKKLARYSSVKVPHVKKSVKILFYCFKHGFFQQIRIISTSIYCHRAIISPFAVPDVNRKWRKLAFLSICAQIRR